MAAIPAHLLCSDDDPNFNLIPAVTPWFNVAFVGFLKDATLEKLESVCVVFATPCT